MNQDTKYEKMEHLGKMYESIGMVSTLATFLPKVKNNDKASALCNIISGTSTILSISNYIASLGKYDDEDDELEIIYEHARQLIIPAVVNTYFLAKWLSSIKRTNKNTIKYLDSDS